MTPAVLAYATSARRPCCALVAVWVLARVHLDLPEDPTSERAWAAVAPTSWRRLCVWDAADRWSCLAESQRLLGGELLRSDTLWLGRWHIVQRWSLDRGHGHTYLVLPMEGGRFRVVQSDVTHGFRDEIRSEWRLPGHEHRALALPPEVV